MAVTSVGVRWTVTDREGAPHGAAVARIRRTWRTVSAAARRAARRRLKLPAAMAPAALLEAAKRAIGSGGAGGERRNRRLSGALEEKKKEGCPPKSPAVESDGESWRDFGGGSRQRRMGRAT